MSLSARGIEPAHAAIGQQRQVESFEHPDPVPQFGRELEVLGLDRAPQLLPQIGQHATARSNSLGAGGGSARPRAGASRGASQQVAQVLLEGRVAVRAAQPSRSPENP